MDPRTPLAWKNLTHDLRRLAVAVTGVGFAVILIFMQLGFLNALLESTVQVLRRLQGEIVLISSAKFALPSSERFDIRRLQQAAGIPGVQSASPVYIEALEAVLRERDQRGYSIRVLAFHENDAAFALDAGVSRSDLNRPGTAIADSANRGKYGIPGGDAALPDFDAELNGRGVQLVGRFRLGVDFANDGNLITSPANFARFFPQRAFGRDPLSVVDLGVVKLDAGADAIAVRQALRTALPADVEIYTKDALIEREMDFWRSNAPVGYIFLVGVYMGFIVGVIICYQIIYSDIAEHMREFATLKAMGYTNSYFVLLVLKQSLYLSLLGYVPGAIISFICYQGLSSFTGLTMQPTLSTAVTVLLVTMAMCMVSGLLALRKLLSVDPAELF